jgi:phospholipid transport system substrate-binding protein
MFKNIKFILVIVAIGFGFNSYASEEDAKNFIKSMANESIKIIKSQDLDDRQKEKDLIQIFDKAVDSEWMAKFVSGRNWRDIEKPKQQDYMKAYRQYLVKTYIPEFKLYSNESVKYNKSSKEYDNEYLVETAVISPNQPAVKVNYKVRKLDNGDYKVFDVIAEGISLITTQRAEFSSIISRKGVDHLIKILNKKTG